MAIEEQLDETLKQAMRDKDEATREKNLAKMKKYRGVHFAGKSGEADHHNPIKNPKWMLSGKMGFKRDRR